MLYQRHFPAQALCEEALHLTWGGATVTAMQGGAATATATMSVRARRA